MDAPKENVKSIRVIIQQRAIPLYRLPVFRELAARPGIALGLLYDPTDRLNAPRTSIEQQNFQTHIAPVKPVRVGPKTLFWQIAQWRMATRKRCDVLVLSWDLHFLLLFPALLRARKRGVATILWGHGYTKEDGSISKSRTLTAKLATGLQFYNRTTAKRYIVAGFPADRIFVALNSLDQTPIEAARNYWLAQPEKLREFKAQCGLENGPVLLFCSRLLDENRCDLVLQAAAQLKSQFPDLRVLMIGDGPERGVLEQLARELDIDNQVIFTGAIYDEEKLAPYFLSSWLFCYPENIGLSLLHAFGYGLPAITSDATDKQNPEIEALHDGENGLLYRHGDIESLTQAIQKICSDKDLREKMSVAALQTVREEFSIQTMADGMEQAIKASALRIKRGA